MVSYHGNLIQPTCSEVLSRGWIPMVELDDDSALWFDLGGAPRAEFSIPRAEMSIPRASRLWSDLGSKES